MTPTPTIDYSRMKRSPNPHRHEPALYDLIYLDGDVARVGSCVVITSSGPELFGPLALEVSRQRNLEHGDEIERWLDSIHKYSEKESLPWTRK